MKFFYSLVIGTVVVVVLESVGIPVLSEALGILFGFSDTLDSTARLLAQ